MSWLTISYLYTHPRSSHLFPGKTSERSASASNGLYISLSTVERSFPLYASGHITCSTVVASGFLDEFAGFIIDDFLSADHWYSHRCSVDWNINCTNDLNLTLNYSHLYHGDRSTITASYDKGGNDTLTYFICLRRYIPELNRVFYNKIACVETNDSVVNVPWRWTFHSNATVFANVFTYKYVLDIFSLACARINITVGSELYISIF